MAATWAATPQAIATRNRAGLKRLNPAYANGDADADQKREVVGADDRMADAGQERPSVKCRGRPAAHDVVGGGVGRW